MISPVAVVRLYFLKRIALAQPAKRYSRIVRLLGVLASAFERARFVCV